MHISMSVEDVEILRFGMKGCIAEVDLHSTVCPLDLIPNRTRTVVQPYGCMGSYLTLEPMIRQHELSCCFFVSAE